MLGSKSNRGQEQIVVSLFFISCQSHQIKRETFSYPGEDVHIFMVQSSTISQKCVFLNAENENKWRYQYYLNLWVDNNHSIQILAPFHMDKEFCQSQIASVEALLKEDSQVKICVRGELEKNIEKLIPSDLTLDYICNSKKCVGDKSTWTHTCPGFIKK